MRPLALALGKRPFLFVRLADEDEGCQDRIEVLHIKNQCRARFSSGLSPDRCVDLISNKAGCSAKPRWGRPSQTIIRSIHGAHWLMSSMDKGLNGLYWCV